MKFLPIFIASLLTFLAILAASCDKTNTADRSFENFMNYSFKQGQKLDDFLAMTTGPLQAKLSSLSPEEIQEFLGVNNLKKKKLKITLQKCTPTQCFLTYIIQYDVQQAAQTDFAVEAKKIAELQLIDGHWKVADIVNQKTFIEAKQSINP